MSTSSRVLEVARQSTPIVAVCGGKGVCAICHIHVMEGADSLSPVTLLMLVNRLIGGLDAASVRWSGSVGRQDFSASVGRDAMDRTGARLIVEALDQLALGVS